MTPGVTKPTGDPRTYAEVPARFARVRSHGRRQCSHRVVDFFFFLCRVKCRRDASVETSSWRPRPSIRVDGKDLIIGSCITHYTVAMSECILPSHHPLKHTARTRISNSHVSHCCRDRSCHRATPQASQPSPSPNDPQILVHVHHHCINQTTQLITNTKKSSLVGSRSDRSMSMRP